MKPITGKASLSVLLGAAFLMATSSIGPGFMLQTAAFTGQLQADFAFAIVVSVIFSIIGRAGLCGTDLHGRAECGRSDICVPTLHIVSMLG